MPEISVVFYQEDDGTVPVLEWIAGLPAKVQVKCLTRIRRLQQQGHQLRRPEADHLRDDIYELRISFQGLNYRILYFFLGRTSDLSSGTSRLRRTFTCHVAQGGYCAASAGKGIPCTSGR